MIFLAKLNLINFFSRLGLASNLSVLIRAFQITSHALSLILVALFFEPNEIGLFYLIISFVAFQAFTELGMSTVIQNNVSHQIVDLSFLDKTWWLAENVSIKNLSYLFKVGVWWFGLGGIGFFIALQTLGASHISSIDDVSSGWETDFFFISLFLGILVFSQVFWAFIIGCNWVVSFYKFKLIQVFLSKFAFWISIFIGLKISAIVVWIGIQCVLAIVYLALYYRQFFIQLLRINSQSRDLHWKKDLMPFQSRIILSWLSGYFIFNSQVPIASSIFGLKEAGLVGMSIHLAGIVSTLSNAFVTPIGPKFAKLAAKNKFKELDTEFAAVLKINLAISLVITVGLLAGGLLASDLWVHLFPTKANPFSLYALFALFVSGHLIVAFTIPMSAYLRANKEEAFAMVSVVLAVMVISLSFYFSNSYGVVGLGLAFITVNLIGLPALIFIFIRCRRGYLTKAGIF